MDIVERLGRPFIPQGELRPLCLEAKEEIKRLLEVCKDKTILLRDAYDRLERLQSDNERLREDKDVVRSQERNGSYEADIEQLQSENEQLRDDLNLRNQTALDRKEIIARLQSENERLRAALKQCVDDLAGWVHHHYAGTNDHPAMKRRYDRDMETIINARAALAPPPQR